MLMMRLRTICWLAFAARVLALIIIINFSHLFTTGYLRSTFQSDDLRYQEGAVIYSQTAKSIIDIQAYLNAFRQVGDDTGYSDVIELWYWMVCVLMYLFSHVAIVKLINILFAVACVSLIYKICRLVFPDTPQVAPMASMMYAVFPYPVIFSCFLYKDQFLTLILLAIIYLAYKSDSLFSPFKFIQLLLLLIVFNMLRSGLFPVIFVCAIWMNMTRQGRKLSLNYKTILLLLFTMIISVILYKQNADIIMHKLEAYVKNRAADTDLQGSMIQYFLINNPLDLWKLPFAYMFTLFSPLHKGGKLTSWDSLTGLLNVINIVVVIGNFVYLFLKRKGNVQFWLAIMLLFTIMLIISMGVSRHFYFLVPFSFIFFADYCIRYRSLSTAINKLSLLLVYFYSVILVFSL